MALRDLKSNLKTLKVDKDRPGGGSSGLPYIKGGLPEDSPEGEYIANLARYSSDGTVRGGLFSTVSSTTDSIRISRFLNDSPKGLLFTSKQIGLQKSNPKIETEARGEILNTQVYSNSNLLAQIAVQGTGEHIPRSGFNVNNLRDDKNKYEEIVSKKATNENRLVTLYNNKILPKVPDGVPNYKKHLGISDNSETLFNYVGGPGSSYGDGDTIIKRSINTPRSYLRYIDNPLGFTSGYKPSFKITSEGSPYVGGTIASKFNSLNIISTNTVPTISFDSYFISLGSSDFREKTLPPDDKKTEKATNTKHFIEEYTYSPPTSSIRPENKYHYPEPYQFGNTMAYSKLLGSKSNSKEYKLQDFRANTIEPSTLKRKYSTENIETRLKLGDPGARPPFQRQFINQVGDGIGQDKINLLPPYVHSGGDPIKDHDVRDMIKFCIEVINNNSTESTVPLHFRAYITDFNDNIGADWNSQKYMGRGENFYTYQGFTREVSFNLKVAAQSKQEMMPLYQKLNYLASSLMPDYNSNGFMRGNLHKLTVGEWFYRTPGVLKSMNIIIDNDYPWEIKYNEPETKNKFKASDFPRNVDPTNHKNGNSSFGSEKFQNSNSDADMMELPQILSINFTFIPILNNLPRLVKNTSKRFESDSILISNHGDNENFLKRINSKQMEIGVPDPPPPPPPKPTLEREVTPLKELQSRCIFYNK